MIRPAPRLENDRLRIDFTKADQAAQLRVRLLDKQTGLTFFAPLVSAGIMWNAVHRPETGEDIEVTGINACGENAVEFLCGTRRSRITWRIQFLLDEACLTARIPWDSLEEERPSQFRLIHLHPVPGLLHGNKTFVVPLKCGALIEPSRFSFRLSDSVLMYGHQPRHEDLPLLPLCGYYDEDRSGMAVIVGEGECDAFYEFQLHGSGAASAGFSLAYRHGWPSPIDPVDRELHFIALSPEQANYAGIGRIYHHYLREKNGVTTLLEKTSEMPEIGMLARSMVFKTFHAMKDLDRECGDGVYHLHQTFGETERQLRQIKAAGIERAAVQLVGWNFDGHDGAYPRRFPVDARPGGEEGMRKLIEAGQRLGFQMQVHDNFADSLDPRDPGVIRRIWGEPVARGIWGGGAIYAVNPQKSDSSEIRAEMERVKALGVRGVYYLDAMAAPLEEDYDLARPSPRRAHAEGLAWAMELGREIFGACGTEMGFAHISRHSDYISNSPLRGLASSPKDAGTLRELVSEWVPLWQIAFHGLLVHALLDAPIPSTVKLLEAAETGAIPRSDFTGARPAEGQILAPQWHKALLPAFKAKYDILSGHLGANAFASIERHRSCGNGVFETVFSNGNCVEVDYGNKRLRLNSHEVKIPTVFDQQLPIRVS